eukprot:TRINITY_DN4222_c0_g2_i1.p1 TRINITY_DN4222_c0_g2~~TRINITY_DN4222_c0_g2_i1.p1  ORF type:complete len:276 (+),score=66.05 TRINITY_DN4222_c0_g2_i1:125-952(+)
MEHSNTPGRSLRPSATSMALGQLLLSLVCAAKAEQSWVISENAYSSYFILSGDVSALLSDGASVWLKGEDYKVELSQSIDGRSSTYVQLDRDHGASIGDTVVLKAAGSESGGSKDTASLSPVDNVVSSGGSSAPEAAPQGAGGFNAAVRLSTAVSLQDVKREVQAQGKPAVVIVTQPWCGACKHLKSSINDNMDQLTGMMDKFVVVHAPGDAGAEWQPPGENDGYIPRVYFMDTNGAFMDVAGPNEQYRYFFQDADGLETAMKQVLTKLGKSAEL